MTSTRKIEASRINGSKSPGPTDTTSTRFNATKHGLSAAGITELDNAAGYRATLKALRQEKAPIGEIENFLVDSIALDMVRSRRARRCEAQFITSELNPPECGGPDPLADFNLQLLAPIVDPGLPASIRSGTMKLIVSDYQRHETRYLNQFFRELHELERIQRMRGGERLPAPASVDVTLCAANDLIESAPVASAKIEVLPSDGASLPEPVIVDHHPDPAAKVALVD
jgi:hypothetical protein